MFFSTLSLGLALMPFVSAAIIDIQVGASGLTYSPDAIGANVGDQVVFHFHAKNHTVTQSSFADPCGPLAGGLSSGFMPVAANQTDNLPTFTVTVKDTKPIWVYCAQGAGTAASHCGAGMVFAINCGQDGSPNSFTNFKASALAVGASLSAAAAAASSTAAPAASSTAAYAYTTAAAPAVTTAATTASTTVSAAGAVHTVVVGGTGILAFTPPFVAAAVQDTIVFEFHQKNHTVTQSSFADPCSPLSANGTVGFDSGFMPVGVNSTGPFPTWNYTVTATTPVWAFCRQSTPSSHCGAGMVFAVNPVQTSAKNFTAFQNVAEALNGTALAAQAPAATTTAVSGASAVRIGSASVTLLIAALIGSLL
ncbi:hypothetical protein HYPSUDRAFT_32662 [Hypholoma sublateritium FD-334 SS-4]|uniref:Cupredoxin n=1 Tax=Hypholoma sublateritium (strain FD-334 SS-4) TaxID=945553 RepID=A0A0D2LMM0_HYPSF|nr:hypothetical protein HYPSUDRAFT_32662 [Hypholoma sublateritium FD-334 SS-4]